MKKLLLFLLLFSSTAFAQDCPADLGTLAVGEWCQMPDNAASKIADVFWSPNPGGTQSDITEAWVGATYDSMRGDLVITGGGHNNYCGNEVYAFNLVTRVWRRKSGSSTCTNGTEVEAYADGTPSARHTYSSTLYDPIRDKLLLMAGGAPWGSSGFFTSRSYAFDMTNETPSASAPSAWVQLDEPAMWPNGSAPQPLHVYDNVNDLVWTFANNGIMRYAPATDVWTQMIDNQTNYGGPNATAIYIPGSPALMVNMGNGTTQAHRLDTFAFVGSETTWGMSGATAIEDVSGPGLVYDANSGSMFAWYGTLAGGTNNCDYYEIVPSSKVSTLRGGTGTCPPNPSPQYVFTKMLSVGEGLAGLITNTADEVWVLRVSEFNGGTPVTTLTLTSENTGTLPFTAGVALAEGDAPTTLQVELDEAEYQVVVKSRWPDSSVKHAIISGYAPLVADTPNELIVYAAATSPSGTDLTAADIATAAPGASIQCGAIGTVNLSALLATPFRTWISGPQMVEAHYRSAVGADATLVAWFHVRLYDNGELWVRTIVENGYLDVATVDKSYVPTLIIDGVTVFSNGGSALDHYAHTRYMAEAWFDSDPEVTPALDTTYLMASKLVPNYWKFNPAAAVLNALDQSYAPMTRGDWTLDMADQGYQPQIGLLPLWDALYVNSEADARAFRSVVANAKALNSYALVWTDSSTSLTPLPTDRPTWTVNGAGGVGENGWAAGTFNWDTAHHGSGGYLAYMLTGDYIFLQAMQDQSALVYLVSASANGSGTARITRGQTRAQAWMFRTMSQYVSIAPTGDAIAADYRELLEENIDHYKGVYDTLGGVGIGYLYEYLMTNYGTDGVIAPWQGDFFIQAIGMGSDLKPLASMTNFDIIRDWLYRAAVGMLGDASGYCFRNAGIYNAKTSNGTSTDPTTWYDTWAEVFTNTAGLSSCDGTTTLVGTSGADPANAPTGYWGNLLPAIAYAVDDGATGAAAAWNRFIGASNFSTLENSGFDDVPIWGIYPRNPPPPSSTVGSGRSRMRR